MYLRVLERPNRDFRILYVISWALSFCKRIEIDKQNVYSINIDTRSRTQLELIFKEIFYYINPIFPITNQEVDIQLVVLRTYMVPDISDKEQFNRRTVLKLAGAGLVSGTAASTATANEINDISYGVYGYGEGGFGGDTDNTLSVVVSGSSNISQTEATLEGEVMDSNGASSVNVRFDYRPVGNRNWQSTSVNTLTDGRLFSVQLSGLEVNTEYEFRAVATADGQTARSNLASFTTLMHTLLIDGRSSPDEKIEYMVSVSGTIEKNSDLGSVQSNDTIFGSTASGRIIGGRDAYRFTGEIIDVEFDGSPALYRNGEEVSSDGIDTESLPNMIIVDGTGADEWSTYQISVSGELRKSPKLGSLQPNDTVSGSTASGQVYGGKDAYRFSGDLTEVSVSGPAEINYIDADG